MHTGITGTTRTFCGRPYPVYPTEHLTHTKHIHNIQIQNSNHTQTHCELFHQTIHKQCQTRNKQDKRSINRATQNIQGHNITLTTTQVQEAIKQSKITTYTVLTN